MTVEQYSRALPRGIGRGYWHTARNTVLLREIAPHVKPGATVLDIGCGPGIIVDFLRRAGVACFGADIGTPEPCVPAVEKYLFLGENAFALRPEFRSSVSVILLMDVLEHLPDPAVFLEQCHHEFPNANTIFLTLPARPELWSNYDEYYGHFRRYTLEMIDELAKCTGFRCTRSRYFFHTLYWAARALKVISSTRSTRIVAPRFPSLHQALGGAFSLEARLLPRSLRGSSALALFERR